MKTSERAIKAIKEFEGFRGLAYRDAAGVLTIGWGDTIHAYRKVCTPEEADQWLREHIATFIDPVLESLVRVPVTQGMWDALSSFSYNLGTGALAGSTLLKILNAKEYKTAAVEFPRWDHCNGRKVPGLYDRRLAEQAWFLDGLSSLDVSA